MVNKCLNLDERLTAHPQLKERVEALLAIGEDTSAAVQQADEAERRVITQSARHLSGRIAQSVPNSTIR